MFLACLILFFLFYFYVKPITHEVLKAATPFFVYLLYNN